MLGRFYLPITLILLGATGLTARAGEVWSGNFETGDLTQWSPKLDAQPGTVDRLVVVPSPAREGGHALKVTVKPGDLDNNGNRAEVVLRDRMFHQGEEVWFHWFTMVPDEFQVVPNWMLFTQWHSGNPQGVPLGFNLHGSRLTMRVMGHKYDAAGDWTAGTLWTDTLVKGEWMEFLVHVRWSEKSDGFVEMWKNGELVVPKTNHPTLDPGDYVYLKQGLYRDKAITISSTIFHDGMTVYDSRPDHLFVVEEPPADDPPTDSDPTDGGTGTDDPSGAPGDEGAPTDGGAVTPVESTPATPLSSGRESITAQPSAGCSTSGAGPLGMVALLLALMVNLRRSERRKTP